jgi:clan AA aspartic protease
MGTFNIDIEIGDTQGRRFERVSAMVDTGASYTYVPRSVLEKLGVKPTFKFPFVLADGREVKLDMAETKVKFDGMTRTQLVVFGEEDTEPLLGAFSLESFGLAVDPLKRKLFPVPGSLR